MSEKNVINLIEEFISAVKSKYNNLHIDYEYNEQENFFDIWHNNENLEFNDNDFANFIGTLFQEIFYKSGVFNVSFGYDFYKSLGLSPRYEFYESKIITPVEEIIQIINKSFSKNQFVLSCINQIRFDEPYLLPKAAKDDLKSYMSKTPINIENIDNKYELQYLN